MIKELIKNFHQIAMIHKAYKANHDFPSMAHRIYVWNIYKKLGICSSFKADSLPFLHCLILTFVFFFFWPSVIPCKIVMILSSFNYHDYLIILCKCHSHELLHIFIIANFCRPTFYSSEIGPITSLTCHVILIVAIYY